MQYTFKAEDIFQRFWENNELFLGSKGAQIPSGGLSSVSLFSRKVLYSTL